MNDIGKQEFLPCPFCGKAVEIDDDDTLYPIGIAWEFDEELQIRTYHGMNDSPQAQWCWGMRCPIPANGCGVMITGDSREDAIAKWNTRHQVGLMEAYKPGYDGCELRAEFDTWLKQDEQLNGCRGLSTLEKDQMFTSYQAACASKQKELDALKLLGYIEESNVNYERAGHIYIVDEDGFDGCTVPVFVRAGNE